MEFAVNGYPGCEPPHTIFPVPLPFVYIRTIQIESFQRSPLVAICTRAALF